MDVHVKEGYALDHFDPVVSVTSDKASHTVTSRFEGTVTKVMYKEGDTAAVGDPVIYLDVDDAVAAKVLAAAGSQEVQEAKEEQSQPAAATSAPAEQPQVQAAVPPNKQVLMVPSVRIWARKYNVDLTRVKPSGNKGHILKEDVMRAVDNNGVDPLFEDVVQGHSSAPAGETASGTVSRAKLTPYQKAMVVSMTESLQIPHFAFKDEVNMTVLKGVRGDMKPLAEARDTKLSFMPFMIKAASLALSEFPLLNSSLDLHAGEVVTHASHNIGIAMDTPAGLIVPVLKDVQSLTILETAQELQRLMAAGQAGKLERADLQGTTFTLSNIGVVGGTYTFPLISKPQVAIGAVGKIDKVPRFNDKGDVVAADIMCVSWSADHRLVDGVTVARFSTLWKDFLENPAKMLLYMA